MSLPEPTPTSRYRGVPLSTELVLGALCILLLALVASGIAVFAAGEKTIRHKAQGEAEIAALAILETTLASPHSDLGARLASTLLQQTPSISGIKIQRGRHTIFQEPPSTSASDPPADPRAEPPAGLVESADRTVSVTIDDGRDTRVTVRIDLSAAAPSRQRLTVYVLLTIGGSIIGAAFLLIVLLHARVTQPLRKLRAQVLQPDDVATNLPGELQAMSDVLATQANHSIAEVHRLGRTEAELHRANALHRLMLRELDHRVRNNLAALAALVDLERYASGDVDTFADRLGARLGSMQQVQELLSNSRDHAVELSSLFASLLPADVNDRVHHSGPHVDIAGAQAVPLGMALHELLTNAMRHGALSSATGIVDVRWNMPRLEADGRRLLQLDWTETGGPRPKESPTPRSGTGILTGLVESELGGSVDLRYPPTGVVHRLMLRLRRLEHAGEL